MTTEKITKTVSDLHASAASLDDSSQWILMATEEELRTLLSELAAQAESIDTQQRRPDFDVVGSKLVKRAERHQGSFEKMTIDRIHSAYLRFSPNDPHRRHFLRMLSTVQGSAELECFADLIVRDPPSDPRAALDAFVPLFQSPSEAYQTLFPRLLDALQHVQVAAIVLDLANYLTKQQRLSDHPMRARQEQTTELLGAIVQQLERINEGRSHGAQAAAQITESVALAISLCQAIVLMQTQQAKTKLHQMMQLSHRRCQIEAAYALASLGDETGRQKLVQLAEESATRLRALAYADELGLGDEVPRRLKTPVAQAEADLVTWLCEPARFGIPPQQSALLAQQVFFWPGFDDPVDCYLFRYTYRMPDGEHTNIGISGPLTMAFAEDLTCLTPQDVFALFAGWHAEHPEISSKTSSAWSDGDQRQIEELSQQLETSRYRQIEPKLLGQFFGDPVLICAARAGTDADAQVGHLLVDSNGFAWLPHRQSQLPINAVHAWSVYQGRKLLQSFNPTDES